MRRSRLLNSAERKVYTAKELETGCFRGREFDDVARPAARLEWFEGVYYACAKTLELNIVINEMMLILSAEFGNYRCFSDVIHKARYMDNYRTSFRFAVCGGHNKILCKLHKCGFNEISHVEMTDAIRFKQWKTLMLLARWVIQNGKNVIRRIIIDTQRKNDRTTLRILCNALNEKLAVPYKMR